MDRAADYASLLCLYSIKFNSWKNVDFKHIFILFSSLYLYPERQKPFFDPYNSSTKSTDACWQPRGF